VKTKLELENEIKKEKLGSEEEDDESSAVAALLFVPTSSMSVNEREEGTLFDTRGTRRTRRDGTRTWSTRASLIFCLWVVVVVVVIACLLPGSQRLISGRRSRQEGTKKKKKKKKIIIRREGGGKGGRSARGRKEAAMGFLVISLYYFLTALVGSLLVRVCYNKGKSTNM
jgi:ABC-type Fe3+ transport system permease subunit